MELFDLQQQAAAYLERDEYDEAIALYEQCIEAEPSNISNYWKLGLTLLLQGQELEAQSCWLSAIVEVASELDEDWTQELINILESEAIKRLEAGKYEQAESIYLQIIEQQPNNGLAYKNLGNTAFSLGKLEEAIAYYQKGLLLQPDAGITYYHLGLIFHKQNKFEQAQAYFEQFLALNPNAAEGFNCLGNSLQRQGKFEEAIACYQKALTLEPNDALTINNLGTTFQAVGKLEEAIACYEKALTLEPNNAMAHNNLGGFLVEQYQFEKGMTCYNRAIEIEPESGDFHWSRASLLLRLGDYKGGFAEAEWRWKQEHNYPMNCPQPLWDGSNLEGRTILLYVEQGLGDTIQFIRFAPLVAQRGGKVVVAAQEPLVRLLTTVPGIDQVVAINQTFPEFDVQTPLLSLPYILGTNLETLPAQVPYLSPPASVSFKLETPDDTYLKVGIVWAGNPKYGDDRKRSCSLNDFKTLLNVPGIAFYSLQKGPKAEEISQLSGQVSLQDLSSHLNDFADTAAIVNQMDLIISTDTSVPHLAGALGRPVWVVLCYSPDWRWMVGREDSPWYPTMHLFRQKQPGNWQEVLERVALALTELVDSRKS